MRTAIAIVMAVCLWSGAALAQGGRFDGIAQSTALVGGSTVVVPLPGAAITVCNHPATGQTGTTACTNKATTYTDATLATPCSTSTQVVLAGTSSCVAAADPQGNYGFWVPAGGYDYSICASGVCSTPNYAYVGVQPNGNNAFTGSNTFSGDVITGKTPFVDGRSQGMKCDGVTNDTTAGNATLALAASLAVPVKFPQGTCLGNFTIANSNTHLGGFNMGRAPSPFNANTGTILQSASGSSAVITINSGLVDVSVENLTTKGTGSGTGDRGIYIPNAGGVWIQHVSCDNFGEECIRWEAGIVVMMDNVDSTNVLLNRTRSVHSGAIYMAGTDGSLMNSELTASVSREGHVISSSLFVDAIVDVGGNNWIYNTVGEISDEGLYITDAHAHVVMNRFDLNYGHGIECSAGGEFSANDVLNNSQDTNNTYDGIHCTGGTASWTGNTITTVSVANAMRYGIFDSQGSQSIYNTYSNNKIINMGTAPYSIATSNGAPVAFPLHTLTIADGVTTPDVGDEGGFIVFGASTPQTITSFINGVPGQVLYLVGNVNTTIHHDGVNILTCNNADETLEVNRTYIYVKGGGASFREAGCAPKNGKFSGTLNVTGTSTLAGLTATSLAVNGGVTLGANQLPVYEAGTATVDKIYTNTQALTAGAATHTLANSFSYTSSATFGCSCTDQTAAAACKAVPASATTVTLAGTGTDVLWLSCSGH